MHTTRSLRAKRREPCLIRQHGTAIDAGCKSRLASVRDFGQQMFHIATTSLRITTAFDLLFYFVQSRVAAAATISRAALNELATKLAVVIFHLVHANAYVPGHWGGS